MRSFVATAGLVALMLYGVAVTGAGVQAEPATAGADLAPLAGALEATGARVETARVTGWVVVHDGRALEAGRQALGAAVQAGALVQSPKRAGAQYLTVNWTLSGNGARTQWQGAAATVRGALSRAGADPMVTVQLEGAVATGQPGDVAEAAVEALSGTGRQAWAGERAASVAARTVWLPSSPLGVNVQAAARRDSQTGQLRVWVAWPALIQEY